MTRNSMLRSSAAAWAAALAVLFFPGFLAAECSLKVTCDQTCFYSRCSSGYSGTLPVDSYSQLGCSISGGGGCTQPLYCGPQGVCTQINVSVTGSCEGNYVQTSTGICCDVCGCCRPTAKTGNATEGQFSRNSTSESARPPKLEDRLATVASEQPTAFQLPAARKER